MKTSEQATVLVMTAGGLNPEVMINALKPHFPHLHVVQEEYESKGALLKRRAKYVGWVGAIGQLLTMICSRLGKRFANRRISEIVRTFALETRIDPAIPRLHVHSLNDPETVAEIDHIKPDVILTISCRLLARRTLAAIQCPIVNFHAGINPAYRGQMGAYWALVERDEQNFGATLHLVDAGTDTGATLAEIRTQPTAADSIATYPLLLTAVGTSETREVLKAVIEGKASPQKPEGVSALRFPPPIWTYLYHGLTRGIW